MNELFVMQKFSLFLLTEGVSALPFCLLARVSQVYLHQLLRQLIRRNLGHHAWEIAGSCSNLPYFQHSLG
jgi:hypothetical protein